MRGNPLPALGLLLAVVAVLAVPLLLFWPR